jgi:serine/threonine-protein kinase
MPIKSSPLRAQLGDNPVGPTRELLLGKYRIVRQIGQGGMGELYLARHLGPATFEKLVVLKRIRPDRLDDPRIVEGFLTEARIAAQLSHRNLVQIFDLERHLDEYIITMEHVVGVDLANALRASSSANLQWPVAICCRVISDLCSGLHAAHTHKDPKGLPRPVIHRDVSPANILIAEDGTVKLTDFGVAKVLGGSRETEPGVFKGKHTYAAPEQLFGNSEPTPQTDIYAAGVVLFEMLTHHRYTLARATSAKGRPDLELARLRPDAPPNLKTILARVLSMEPERRHESAQELRDSLEVLLRRESASADDLARWMSQLETPQTSALSGADETITTGSSADQPTATTRVSADPETTKVTK